MLHVLCDETGCRHNETQRGVAALYPQTKQLASCPAPLPQDHEALRAAGVTAIYGPGTRVPAAALDILSQLLEDPSVKEPTCKVGVC